MEKFNFKIYVFQKALQKIIEQSELPIGAIYSVLKNNFQSIQHLYFQQVEKEFQQQQQQQEKQKEENSSQTSQD